MLTDEEAMELMAEDMSIDIPIKHESKPYLMIPLSDEATNGDVIKALFPNDDINPSTITSIIQKIPFGRNEYCSDWWNAPYKRGN